MCGIAGIYNLNPNNVVEPEHLWKMGDEIAHRGPDNKSIYHAQNMGLAYRRLSIIDTLEREQPILRNEDDSLHISFNGEIYNFQALKEELVEKGHEFYTGTDTEMILHLYEEEGVNCVTRLNGIFAFAIMDERDHSMFIARDQLGIKPLYYTHRNESIYFSSEIKALLVHSDVKRQVNPESLDLYFRYRFVPDPLTMFDEIYKLPPGHTMIIKDGDITFNQYFSLSKVFTAPDRVKSEEEAIEVVRDSIKDAIHRQLLADVPLGAFLSGGIDSSIVVGVMSEIMDTPVNTFSVGFSDKEYDEMYFARQVSERYKTNHHELVLSPEHVKELENIIWHLDEPLADPAAVPTYFISKLAREHVTVVLTGEGGDELFAGYKEDFTYPLQPMLSVLSSDMRQALAETVASTPLPKGKTKLMRTLQSDRQRAEHILTDLFRFEQAPVLPYKNSDENIPINDFNFDYYWNKTKGMDWTKKMLYLESKIWLPGDPLMKVDKMTMGHSLEARVPLLDMEVVHLAGAIPTRFKNPDMIEKSILRNAFKDILPHDILERKKSAFEIPVKSWLQNELKPMVETYLSKESLSRSGYINADQAHAVVQQHLNGKRDYKYEVWALLVFQIWHERWL